MPEHDSPSRAPSLGATFGTRVNIRYPDRPIVFVHIPKTAGTSFSEYLRQNMRSPQVVAPTFIGDWDTVAIESRRHDFYTGHFPYHAIASKRLPFHYLTFLRDPVQRAVSQWKSWHRKENLTKQWRKVMQPYQIQAVEFAQNVGFETFVQSENTHVVGNISNMYAQYIADRFPTYGGPADTASAIANLENTFLFVGIVEEFNASMELFRRVFPGAGEYELADDRENRSTDTRVVPSPSALRRIQELNSADLQIYEFARSLFKARCQHYGIELSAGFSAVETWTGEGRP